MSTEEEIIRVIEGLESGAKETKEKVLERARPILRRVGQISPLVKPEIPRPKVKEQPPHRIRLIILDKKSISRTNPLPVVKDGELFSGTIQNVGVGNVKLEFVLDKKKSNISEPASFPSSGLATVLYLPLAMIVANTVATVSVFGTAYTPANLEEYNQLLASSSFSPMGLSDIEGAFPTKSTSVRDMFSGTANDFERFDQVTVAAPNSSADTPTVIVPTGFNLKLTDILMGMEGGDGLATTVQIGAQIKKSTDLGKTFQVVATFGSNPQGLMQISWSKPKLFGPLDRAVVSMFTGSTGDAKTFDINWSGYFEPIAEE